MSVVVPEIDRWLDRLAAVDDPVLAEMQRLGQARGFPIVGPQVGRLLEVLARATGALRVLELGSGFGYSAAWFLRGMAPEGRIVLTDGSGTRADEAREFLTRAGHAGRFEIHVGDALAYAAGLPGPFDIVFNDIDKQDYPRVHDLAARLLRPGGLLVSDNMLWSGRVADPQVTDAATEGVRRLVDLLYASTALSPSLLPVRDGVVVAVRL